MRRIVAPFGLSPRVRGKPRAAASVNIVIRSIPACAGEAEYLSTDTSTGKVYPRVCGGSREGLLAHLGIQGLSPRVRGKPGRAA